MPWEPSQEENRLREELVAVCKRLHARQMVSSTGGNVSARQKDHVFITPGGESLATLAPDVIVKVDLAGIALQGGKPSKELLMHCAIYQKKEDVRAVVHAHSPYAIAMSCIPAPGTGNGPPPMTPGYVVRVGKLPLVTYLRAGSVELAESVAGLAPTHRAVLLQNHGLIAFGRSLEDAVNSAEAVEENARIYLLTGGKGRSLSPDEARGPLRAVGKHSG